MWNSFGQEQVLKQHCSIRQSAKSVQLKFNDNKQQANSGDKTERCKKNDRLSKKGLSGQCTTEQSKVTYNNNELTKPQANT